MTMYWRVFQNPTRPRKTENMFQFELGKKVRSKVTGLTGIITSRSECLYGCNRYYLQPPVDSDSKVPDGWWIDEGDVEQVGDGVTAPRTNTGGPMSKVR